MNTCSTCGSWQTIFGLDDRGFCDRIANVVAFDSLRLPPSEQKDGSELAITPRAFGCNLWKRRPS